MTSSVATGGWRTEDSLNRVCCQKRHLKATENLFLFDWASLHMSAGDLQVSLRQIYTHHPQARYIGQELSEKSSATTLATESQGGWSPSLLGLEAIAII